MSQSVIPGERDITPAELQVIRTMHAEGRNPAEIAAAIGGVDVMRIAALVAPKRAAPRKVWKGKRR